MSVFSACLRWTEVSHHTLCNVVVKGVIEHPCDLFHRFAWTTVRRAAPRAHVCQRERCGMCRLSFTTWKGRRPPYAHRAKWSAVRLDGVTSTQTRAPSVWVSEIFVSSMITGTLCRRVAAGRERAKAASRACTLEKLSIDGEYEATTSARPYQPSDVALQGCQGQSLMHLRLASERKTRA